MPRKLLLFAALAVVGSMFALWLVTRDSSGSSSASPAAETTIADSRAPATRDRVEPALPGSTDQPAASPAERTGVKNPRTTEPGRPNAGTVESVERGTHADEVREPPLEYTLPDGRKVRDFRDPSRRKPLELPPSVHAPGGRKIPPQLTELYTKEILKHMSECGREVPKEVLAERPRLEGQIVIAIKQAQGSVTSAIFKLTGVTSEAIAETARQCVEQKTLTVKVPAQGEADLDSYSINLSFAFP